MKLNPHATEFTWTPAAAEFPPLRPSIRLPPSPDSSPPDPSPDSSPPDPSPDSSPPDPSPDSSPPDPSPEPSPTEPLPSPSLRSLNGRSPAASPTCETPAAASDAGRGRVYSVDEINALQAGFGAPPENLPDGDVPVKGNVYYEELMDPQRVVSRRSSITSWKGSPRSMPPHNRNRSIVRRQQLRDPSPMEPIDPDQTANSRNARIVAAADARHKPAAAPPQKKPVPAPSAQPDDDLSWRKRDSALAPTSKSWRDRTNPPKRRAQQLYEQAAAGLKLTTSANAWRPIDKSTQDEAQAAEAAIRVILNKLTPETFAKLADAAAEIDITRPETLRTFCKTMFDKAIDETSFASLYGQFIVRLQEDLPSFKDEEGKVMDVRSEIITRCYQMLTTPSDPTAFASLQGAERDEARFIQRRRQIGNVVLMGELFKHGLLVEDVVHVSIGLLLAGPYADIEMLVAFLQTVGKFIDRQAPAKMEEYFAKIISQSKQAALAPRLRFMLMDLLDLRRNFWRLRRDKVVDPKMLDELRKGASANSAHSSSWTVKPPPKKSLQTARPTATRPTTKVTWKAELTSEPSKAKPFSWGNVPRDIHDDEEEEEEDEEAVDSVDNANETVPVKARDEKEEQRVEMLIRELFSCLDVDEALRCARELSAASYPDLVYQAVMISFDMKDSSRELCHRFLDRLMTDGVVTGDDLVQALTNLVQECDDLAIDIPRAPTFLTDALRDLLSRGHLDLESLMGVLQKSGSTTCSKLALQALGRSGSDFKRLPLI